MEPLQLEQLAALHALRALDGEDLELARRLIEDGDEDFIRLVDEFEKTGAAAVHALAVKEPRAGVKGSLMKRVHESIGRERSTEGPFESKRLPPSGFKFLYRDDIQWVQHAIEGVWFKELSRGAKSHYSVMLYKLSPGAMFPAHHHSGDEECYVLEGDLHVGSDIFGPGDFIHADAGTDHAQSYSERGCTVLLVVPPEDYT